uniref:Uncharacterized protein n=1 Tax=Timema cristinae TaxID=61476 RepID=A0A7R9D194_TIMCR|nr:unnamed protein product [Timema cristinae]
MDVQQARMSASFVIADNLGKRPETETPSQDSDANESLTKTFVGIREVTTAPQTTPPQRAASTSSMKPILKLLPSKRIKVQGPNSKHNEFLSLACGYLSKSDELRSEAMDLAKCGLES